MTESTQPGDGWTASHGDDSWTAETRWLKDDTLAEPGAHQATPGGGTGQSLQGFGEVTDGYGSLTFGADAGQASTRPSPGPGPAAGAETALLAPVRDIDGSAGLAVNGQALTADPHTAGAPTRTVVPQALAASDDETITCPECGTAAQVTLNRRDSVDFCRTCDYPLFWTPSKILRDRSSTDESLRRLPGTEGRATIASLPCPHCAEPNSLSALICVRCGQGMHLSAPPPAPPAPAPVYTPPPDVPLEEQSLWWVWLLLGLTLVAIVTLVILRVTDVIG